MKISNAKLTEIFYNYYYSECGYVNLNTTRLEDLFYEKANFDEDLLNWNLNKYISISIKKYKFGTNYGEGFKLEWECVDNIEEDTLLGLLRLKGINICY